MRSMITKTSTRRCERSSGLVFSLKATEIVMTPFWTVGTTLATVPFSVSSPMRTATGSPADSRRAWTSETVASTRYDDRSATRAMTSPL